MYINFQKIHGKNASYSCLGGGGSGGFPGRGVLKTKFKTKNILNVIITKVDYFKHIKAD